MKHVGALNRKRDSNHHGLNECLRLNPIAPQTEHPQAPNSATAHPNRPIVEAPTFIKQRTLKHLPTSSAGLKRRLVADRMACSSLQVPKARRRRAILESERNSLAKGETKDTEFEKILTELNFDESKLDEPVKDKATNSKVKSLESQLAEMKAKVAELTSENQQLKH